MRNFDDKQQEIFSRGVQAVSSGPANSLASNYDFTRHRRVLDLGGGTGSFLTAILSRYGEHLEEGALFELPRTTAVAREAISKGPFSGKIKIIEGDFFKDQIPCGHDVVILANVVHLFTPEHNLELLRRIRGRVADGARLLLVDFWTDPSHTDPLPAPFLAGEFLLVTGEGDVYSEEEVSAWLASTGWTKVERKPLEGAASLIIAETKAA